MPYPQFSISCRERKDSSPYYRRYAAQWMLIMPEGAKEFRLKGVHNDINSAMVAAYRDLEQKIQPTPDIVRKYVAASISRLLSNIR